jgi:hypothetical protein
MFIPTVNTVIDVALLLYEKSKEQESNITKGSLFSSIHSMEAFCSELQRSIIAYGL